jgi:hypothetical protein
MKLFCFASRSEQNIWIGVQHQLWAVATLPNQITMAARTTRARRYLEVGDRGILYSNQTHAFTTPFIVRSKADPSAVVMNVWPEPWRLPFKIETFGDPSRQVSKEKAMENWPIVQSRMGPMGGVTAAMNITGATVFSPVPISSDDWTMVCEDLATGDWR